MEVDQVGRGGHRGGGRGGRGGRGRGGHTRGGQQGGPHRGGRGGHAPAGGGNADRWGNDGFNQQQSAGGFGGQNGQSQRGRQRTGVMGDSQNWTQQKREQRRTDVEMSDAGSAFSVRVTNVPNGTHPEQLIKYLKEQSNFRHFNANTKGDALFFTVKTQHEADAISGMNGLLYGTKNLVISVRQAASSNTGGPGGGGRRIGAAELSRVLPEYVATCYNKELRMLDLSGINSRQSVFKIDLNNSQMVRALLSAVASVCPEVVTISFQSNDIKTLFSFGFLNQTLPAVENVSFENNNISDIKEIAHLSKLKLAEIVFEGNPIASDPRYNSEVRQRLTSLKRLDKQPLAPIISFDVDTSAISATTTIPPQRESAFDSDQQRQWVLDFLTRYFSCYDGNRNDLFPAYIPESIFSLSFSAYSVPGASMADGGGRGGFNKRGGRDFHSQGDSHEYQNYKKISRNLAHVKDRKEIDARTFKGNIAIVHTLTTLPASKHSASDMIIDALNLPAVGKAAPMMLVTLHGHFWETVEFGAGQNVAFDRALILAPAAPNSPAAAAGWTAIVVNDQLHIRNYVVPQKANSPNMSHHQPQPQSTNPYAASGLTDQQLRMIQQLRLVSNLNQHYAKRCLEESGWNYDAAVAYFWNAHRAKQITPDMYQM